MAQRTGHRAQWRQLRVSHNKIWRRLHRMRKAQKRLPNKPRTKRETDK